MNFIGTRRHENISNAATREPTVTDPLSSTQAPPPRIDTNGTSAESRLSPARIQLTGPALSAIREMMAEEGLQEEGGLRLTAHTGAGCSAPLGYGMVLEPAPDPGDRVLAYDGVRLFLAPESAWMLDGLVVDYVTSSPMGEGFAFRHRRGSCGPSC